ncbi:MAG: hypothetical protein AAGA84_11305, partial [Pseudomonadota bacterium]
MNAIHSERPDDEPEAVEDANTDNVDDEEFSTTIVIENQDNVGGMSVEINVKDLVSDIEDARSNTEAGVAARRRLEALLEEKRLSRLLDEDDDFGIG